MYGYKVFYNGKTADIYANSLWGAKQEAIKLFKVPRSKESMVSVVLCEGLVGEQIEVSIVAL